MIWVVLVAVYILWNLLAYMEIGNDSFLLDCAYWIGERAFVLVTFILLVRYLQQSRYKKYVWVAKTLAIFAALKLLYVILVVAGVLQINQLWHLMALIFLTIIGYSARKWERLQ